LGPDHGSARVLRIRRQVHEHLSVLVMLVSLGRRYHKYSSKAKNVFAHWVRECILDHFESFGKNNVFYIVHATFAVFEMLVHSFFLIN
jgi:hypothetical protein